MKIERETIQDAMRAVGWDKPIPGIPSSPNHMAGLVVEYSIKAFGLAPETISTGRGYTMNATVRGIGRMVFRFDDAARRVVSAQRVA